MNSKIECFSQTAAVFRWKPVAWLTVDGEDAFPFLQGQFSNDLRPLEQRQPVYGLWLDRKGKVLADSFVLPDPASTRRFRIASYHSSVDTIRQRLEDFIVADDVTLVDETGQWEGITISAQAMSPQLDEILRGLGAVWFHGRRGFSTHEWIVPTQHARDAALVESLRQLTELSPIQMEELRIAARIPAIPRDIGPTDLPQEGGLDADAVSFSKGCYLGQEVMARLKTMGTVRRQLFRVHATCDVPILPAPLYQNGKRIGELRTAIASSGKLVGLALLSTISLNVEAPLHFSEDTSSPAIVIHLP